MRTFEELVAEAEAAPVEGWDFSWLAGRATEQRPSWDYSRLVTARMATVSTALDLDTGGGEVLAGLAGWPLHLVATESWPPNVAQAAGLLRPRGGWVIATGEDDPALPFRYGVFDLVMSRHPVDTWWQEVARVLRPGGTFLAQEIGPAGCGVLQGQLGLAHPAQAVDRLGDHCAGIIGQRAGWVGQAAGAAVV